jgi:hypothetical protein
VATQLKIRDSSYIYFVIKMKKKSAKGKHRKLLSCVFFDDVLCSFRKSERSGIMSKCWKCPYFKRFEWEMDEEDARVMDEIDTIWKYGYDYDKR